MVGEIQLNEREAGGGSSMIRTNRGRTRHPQGEVLQLLVAAHWARSHQPAAGQGAWAKAGVSLVSEGPNHPSQGPAEVLIICEAGP